MLRCLSVSASNQDGFTVRATTLAPISLPLDKLVKTHGPGVPVPSNLTVNYLDVLITPGQRYAMDVLLASAPTPWTLDVGKERLTMSDVALQFERPATGAVTGSFSGRIAFAGTTLQANYTFPGNFLLRGMLPPIKLSQVLATLSNQAAKLPGGFDLDLPTSVILIQEQQGSLVFQLAADVKGFGLLAFEARKVSGSSWGFAFGIDLSAGQPSQVPGLAALAALEKKLHLAKFLLVVSSIDQPGFQLPDAAQFNSPQLATKKVALPGSGGVTAGLNVFADWTLDSGDKQQNLLKQLLGLEGSLGVAIQIPPSPGAGTRLFISRSGKLQGHPFLYKLGVQLDAGVPSFFLTGSVTVAIQKQPQTFDLTTLFVPGGAFLSATMKGATAIDCGAFKLANLALEVGVNWAGLPSLGVAATIDVKDLSSSVAVFFDSTDPARSLIAGSISNLTAHDILRAFAGGIQTPLDGLLKFIALKGTQRFAIPGDLTDELDGLVVDKVAAAFAAAKVAIPASAQQLTLVTKTRGAAWHLTDRTKMRHYQLAKSGDNIQVEVAPQFYFAPQPTSIGTIPFPQGFYLNAALSFAGFDAAATIEISANKGFAIDAQLDKVVILDEKLFSISALQGGGGPKISVSTFAQPDHPVAQFRLPHFYINGSLTLLGIKQGLYANVSVQGIDFELIGQLVPGVNFDLDVRFGKAGIGANGKVKVGVGTIDLGKLGKAKINTQLEVEVDLDIDNAARDVTIKPGSSFPKGTTLIAHERARVDFQSDGNLVLYQSSGQPMWASNTVGRGAERVDFQSDGNLVIYSSSGPIWASNTCLPNIARLTLQSDGNLVIYDAAGGAPWATCTNGPWTAAGSHLELETSFMFAGQHVHIAKFRVDAKADTFTQLPALINKKVEEALRVVFKDMTQWTNAVKNGVMDGVDDTAKVFKDVYGKSEQEAKVLAGAVNKGVGQATKAVENVAKDVGKTTVSTTKKVIKKLKFW